jgi:hypothetical protein
MILLMTVTAQVIVEMGMAAIMVEVEVEGSTIPHQRKTVCLCVIERVNLD